MELRKRVLWSVLVLLLAATPARALKVNPDVTNVAEGGAFSLTATVQGQNQDCIYAWSQTNGPTAASFQQSKQQPKQANGIAPTVDKSEAMTFQVLVTKPAGTNLKCDETGSATVTINVLNSNTAPTAAITFSPVEVYEGTSVAMNANGQDADGDALTYEWVQTGGPAVQLSSANDSTVYFTAPNDPNSSTGTNLEFKVTVRDPSGSIGTSTKSVPVMWDNDPPKAVIVCTPTTVDEGKMVTLDATGSTDNDDGIASFSWSQTLGYGGTSIALPEDQTTSKFAISAPSLTSKNNKMTFQIEVADKTLKNSSTCDIQVNDITKPVFANMPTDTTPEATSAAGALVAFAPTATDAVDGVRNVTCNPVSGSIFKLDIPTKVTCSAADESGNTAEASFNVTVVDHTPPELKLPAPIGPIEGDSFGGAKIDYSASASDNVDGNVNVDCDKKSSTVFPVGITTVSCSATDVHGNPATGTFIVTVKDTKAPDITIAGDNIADGNSYFFDFVPPAPTCKANDIVSGSVPCTVTGYGNSVGDHTLTFSATDGANNTNSFSRIFTVLPWSSKGFYRPVDMTETNSVKAGSTVPLKFQVFAGTTELTGTSSISSIEARNVSCSSVSSSEAQLDAVSTDLSSLRYDLTARQFIYNWQTPKTPGCHTVTVTTKDGSPIRANFRLK
jgi:hypothetical protein